jgi:hypothetical protein
MKRFSSLTFCLFLATVLTISASAQQVFKTTKPNVIGYLEYLPKDYQKSSADYPVVIFLHGIGERGPNSKDPVKLKDGESKLTKLGPPHYVKKGTEFPFILISPQLKSGYGDWPLWYIMEVIDHVKKNLRIDESRIYLTGLSLGGGGVWTAAEQHPDIFAAVAPVCGSRNALSKAKEIAAVDLPVWAFHGDKDNIIPWARTANMVNAINTFNPNPQAIFTKYKGVKHNAWDLAYQPDHSIHNPNVYEWMMSQSKKGAAQQQQIVNKAPSVSAGSDREITVDKKSIEIIASASDPDGKITKYEWTKTKGGNVRMERVTTTRLLLSGFAKGEYEFKLTVTDDKGLAVSDKVRLVVTEYSGTGLAALAGPDRYLKLPVTTYSMAGGATSRDGVITSYVWRQVDGEAVKLSDADTRVMRISDVKTPGKRTFTLTVKDSKGRIALDHVRIFFEPQPTSGDSFDEAAVVDNSSNELTEGMMEWKDKFVTVYNERGQKLFDGKWSADRYQEVFQQKGLFIYRVNQPNHRMMSGKIFIQ